MAVPTILTVTPNLGPTMGRTMFEITGTNFRLPPVPPPGPTNKVTPRTVEVLFGAEVASSVRVVSSTLLRAVSVPIDPGVYGVTVRNLDDDGVLIPTEEATLAAAITFRRPAIRAEMNAAGEMVRRNESPLAQVVRAFIREIKRQVIPEVVLTTDTDYFDEETGTEFHLVNLGALPCVTLVGPDLVENRMYSENARPDYDEPDNEFVTLLTPRTVDLQFDVLGIADKMVELMNLMHAMTMFFEQNKYLRMQKDPSDPSRGFIEYEMDFQRGGDFKAARTSANNSNIRQFMGAIEIRGVNIETLFGIDAGETDGGIPLHAVIGRSRTHDDVEVQLDPIVQVGVTSGTMSVVEPNPPGAFKTTVPPHPCSCGDD